MAIMGVSSGTASYDYSSFASENLSKNVSQTSENLQASLSAGGVVDQQTQSVIRGEVALAVYELLNGEESDSLSSESLGSTIEEVLAGHGLNSIDMLKELGTSRGPFKMQFDGAQVLMDLLEEKEEGGSKSDDSDFMRIIEDRTDFIMDHVLGIDTEA